MTLPQGLAPELQPEHQALLRSSGAEVADWDTALGQFGHLSALLLEASATTNLTALRNERDIVIKHFIDSLTCLRGGYLQGQLRVLDIGTGAGFPALPLAIAQPDLQITALDATRKKVDFVARAAGYLGLSQVTALAARAEDLGRAAEHREAYDRVVTRAVAALPVLAELALPFLAPGGLLLAQKADLSPEELDAGLRAAQEVGGEGVTVDRFHLPAGDARSLVIIRKVAPTPERYPRRAGMPAKQPLFWRAT
ncbi:16S rRNA (guanine(527)-N(7))-methyltransferase RsmG [Deinococcus lacus]|uniref:Ribosomal RNA small subunit methyltransferase G n=1 Tax=Deinococcus lacus TaxID=392561 RepID=A0ABW1YCD3_9DEIO